MEKDKRTTGNGSDLPYQDFNGKRYRLYKNERYYSRGCRRMHEVVWESRNGKRPEGYHIHHKDGNTHNNDIENLSLVRASLHHRFESKKRHKEDPEYSKKFHEAGIEAAKEWHASEEGRKWHSEHGKRTWINREYKTLKCEVCGKGYKSRHSARSKYCHQNCKAKALRKRRKQEREGL